MLTKQQPKPEQPEQPVIREMPDRNLLAEFIRGLSGVVTVIFNSESGKFERVKPGPTNE